MPSDQNLSKDSILYFGHLEEDHKLRKMLDKKLDQFLVTQKLNKFPDYFWGAEKYGLEKSHLFKKLKSEEQTQVLKQLSQMNLALSWYIERAAYTHGAKMILASTTQEEKMFYCQFAFEEAIHQREFENMMDFIPEEDSHWHPMVDVLSDSIQFGERETSIFMVQVILEGYGMYFYKALMDSCLHSELKKVYRRILTDEADHHGSGLILSEQNILSEKSKQEIFKYSQKFLEAIQISGELIKSIESVHGKLSKEEKDLLIEEIGYKRNLEKRIKILKDLLKRVDHWGLSSMLEDAGSFEVKELS
ncbi:MAG: hypothetical protein H6621_03435 [Halobacteriovoraceae bacterium]|nr:hypothetical protein [Halobacteriovoraceae bacterium]MCB9094100.1 hypothetical protein [Halobacteriovoraceae bacterium]